MRKVEIIPGVVVYKNYINDIQNILKLIQESETETNGMFEPDPNKSVYHSKKFNTDEEPPAYDVPHVLKKWAPWYDFGIKSQFTFYNKEDSENLLLNEHIKMQKELIDKQFICYYDYVSEYKDKLDWPDYVTNWELAGGIQENRKEWETSNPLIFSSCEILKHNSYYDKEYAIPWHTDFWNHQGENAGMKFIITATVYLNDNYDGGEIQFINYKEKKLVTYKPEAGDITFFPSAHPFWHSALPVKNGNKYLARTLILLLHPGTEEWQKRRAMYDDNEWEKLEIERIAKENEEGKYGFNIVVEGKEISHMGKNHETIVVEKENNIYINGKDI